LGPGSDRQLAGPPVKAAGAAAKGRDGMRRAARRDAPPGAAAFRRMRRLLHLTRAVAVSLRRPRAEQGRRARRAAAGQTAARR
jgi:hypothetical protein